MKKVMGDNNQLENWMEDAVSGWIQSLADMETTLYMFQYY